MDDYCRLTATFGISKNANAALNSYFKSSFWSLQNADCLFLQQLSSLNP